MSNSISKMREMLDTEKVTEKELFQESREKEIKYQDK